MAAISNIQGLQDPVLTGQVEKTTRSAPQRDTGTLVKEMPETTTAKGVQQVLVENAKDPKVDFALSYEQTREVAERLQNRIDEVAADPHQVAIHHDEKSNQFVIEIQDPNGNVVKQFPPEKVLNLHQRLDDLSGMVIDEMI